MPFSDVTERILNLLDFRVGVLDKDTFGLIDKVRRPDGEGFVKALESRRYLYLTATFEGGWEPYMRLIWKPLGSFLDLLFCNCEGYVTATEHGCEEYLQWVRDNQMDSAIFYAVTGLTTRDGRYLSRLERLQRDGAGDLKLAKFTMPYPDPEAEASRLKHLRKTVELGFEAMIVLYKLADYYPPEWLTGKTSKDGLLEGHRLLRAGAEILQGWQQVTAIMDAQPEPVRSAWLRAKETYAEPLDWFNTGLAHVKKLDAQAAAAIRPDPTFAAEQVQGGILERKGLARPMIRQGALLLFTIRNTAAARAVMDAADNLLMLEKP